MSIKVMNLVWGSTLKSTTKRFALLALADRASDQGECSALGVPNLCRKTGIPRSTMFGLLRDLETDNLILREEQTRANGSRKASRFWINLPLLKEMQRPDDDGPDDDEKGNPFEVSAAQPPVQEPDGGSAQVIHTPVQQLDPLPVREPDGGSPAPGPLDPCSLSEKDPDPETDGQPATGPQNDHAAALATRIVGGLDLRCDPSPKQVRQITAAIAGALTRGVAPPVVAEYARRKAREAETVKYFLRAFSAEHLPADATPSRPVGSTLPPVCGQCDARPGDPVSGRVVWLDTKPPESRPCPRCHPRAINQATGGAQ